MKRFTLAAVLLLALPSFADSFDQFALQGGRFPLSPDSNPLLTTSSPGNGPWDALLFFTIFNFNGPVTVTYKVDIGNLHFVNTDSFPGIDCAYSQTYLLSGFPTPTQGTLTVTVNGKTKVYPFRFAAVPEPATLLLLGTGLASVACLWLNRSFAGR